jgi:hypothetical protein
MYILCTAAAPQISILFNFLYMHVLLSIQEPLKNALSKS